MSGRKVHEKGDTKVNEKGDTKVNVKMVCDLFAHKTLRGVIKESEDIAGASMCTVYEPFSNLLATCAKNHATIYSVHDLGEIPDVMGQFTCADPSVDLSAIAWIVPEDNRDALLMLGGAKKCILVVSLALNRELEPISLPRPARRLVSCRGRRDLLFILDSRGGVIVVHVPSRTQCALLDATDISAIAVSHDGSVLYTGSLSGVVKSWVVPDSVGDGAVYTFSSASSSVQLSGRRAIWSLAQAQCGVVALDSKLLTFLVEEKNPRMYEKGRVLVGDIEWQEEPGVVVKAKQGSINLAGAVSSSCSISVASDGAHVLVGGTTGKIMLYSLVQMAHVGEPLDHDRSLALTHAMFDPMCRNILTIGPHPFVGRWKFIDPQTWEKMELDYCMAEARREFEYAVQEERKKNQRPAASEVVVDDQVPSPEGGWITTPRQGIEERLRKQGTFVPAEKQKVTAPKKAPVPKKVAPKKAPVRSKRKVQRDEEDSDDDQGYRSKNMPSKVTRESMRRGVRASLDDDTTDNDAIIAALLASEAGY